MLHNWESGGEEGANTGVGGKGRGDGQAGDPPNKELGHLEVREWAMAQKWGKGRNLGLVHSFIGSFIQ